MSLLSSISYTQQLTYTHLTALCPGLPGWAGTKKVKPIWIFTEARDSEWQWNQLGHMQVCTSLQTDNHATTQFFTGQMPFLPPNQQCQSTEGTCNDWMRRKPQQQRIHPKQTRNWFFRGGLLLKDFMNKKFKNVQKVRQIGACSSNLECMNAKTKTIHNSQ